MSSKSCFTTWTSFIKNYLHLRIIADVHIMEGEVKFMILVKDQNNQMILNDNVKWLRRRQLCKFKLLIQTEREKLVGKDTQWTLTVIIIYFKKFYFFKYRRLWTNFSHCVGDHFPYQNTSEFSNHPSMIEKYPCSMILHL